MKPKQQLKMALSFSISEERKEAIDRRCASLGISRSDYLNELVTRELAQGPNAKFIISPVELEPKKRPSQGPPNWVRLTKRHTNGE